MVRVITRGNIEESRFRAVDLYVVNAGFAAAVGVCPRVGADLAP
jgi:hypothetical protein